MSEETKTGLLDEEGLARVADLLKERHGGALKLGETLRLDLWAEDGGAYGTLLLANADESLYYPMETRIALASGPAGQGEIEAEAASKGADGARTLATLDEAGALLVDVLDFYIAEYLKGDREVYLTIDWSDLRFGDFVVQTRGQVHNRKLERMADELLRQAEGDD